MKDKWLQFIIAVKLFHDERKKNSGFFFWIWHCAMMQCRKKARKKSTEMADWAQIRLLMTPSKFEILKTRKQTLYVTEIKIDAESTVSFRLSLIFSTFWKILLIIDQILEPDGANKIISIPCRKHQSEPAFHQREGLETDFDATELLEPLPIRARLYQKITVKKKKKTLKYYLTKKVQAFFIAHKTLYQ